MFITKRYLSYTVKKMYWNRKNYFRGIIMGPWFRYDQVVRWGGFNILIPSQAEHVWLGLAFCIVSFLARANTFPSMRKVFVVAALQTDLQLAQEPKINMGRVQRWAKSGIGFHPVLGDLFLVVPLIFRSTANPVACPLCSWGATGETSPAVQVAHDLGQDWQRFRVLFA